MNIRVEICGIDTSMLPKLSHEESTKLIEKIKSGDYHARQQFIIANTRLVLSVVQRFNTNRNNIDDVFQVGCIGLIKAIDNFDTSHGVRFSTYAVPMIMGEIRRYLRDTSTLKVTRSIRDTAYKALRTKEEIERRSNSLATIAEIASALSLPENQIATALSAILEPMSLFEPMYNKNGDAIMLMDKIADGHINESSWIENVALSSATEKLDKKEKKILYLRYYVGKTQTEISKSIGISQAQVSRLEKNAMKTLAKEIGV